MEVTGTWKDEADAIQAEAIATIQQDMLRRKIGALIDKHRFSRRAALLCGQSVFAFVTGDAANLRAARNA